MKRLLFLTGLLLSMYSASASHLVGGFMNYEWIGKNGQGGVRYKVTLTVYRDCKSSVEFDDDIEVCVYRADTRQLYRSVQFKRSGTSRVDPVGRTDCPEAAQACLERTFYIEFVDLPANTFGYFLKWERCCRNVQVNLDDDNNGEAYQGQTYQCFIPNTLVKNSSPYFTDIPVPFMCINDLTEIRNTATDPDGDSLVYKLVRPWQGASSSEPFPSCKNSFSQSPDVIYRSGGYSKDFPFGLTGTATINSQNGLTEFMSTQLGNFAVAIEVSEYRNGILLSTIRLDLQILVINCRPNNKPEISNNTNLSYTVTAGATLCFNVTATDKDAANLLTMKGYGDILQGTNGYVGPRATFATAVGRSPVISQFCWKTDCNLARTEPYLVTVEVVDDGCPSKYTNVNISIFVKPFVSNVTLSGPASVCQVQKNVKYEAKNGQTGSSYQWTIEGGTEVGTSSGPSVIVNWGNEAAGKITVTEISQYGCKGAPVSMNVAMIEAPDKPVLIGVDTVCELQTKNYVITSVPGYTYSWFVTKGSILGNNTQNSVMVQWGSKGKATLKVIQKNAVGCPSDTAQADITIVKPETSKITGPTSVCPNVKNIDYSVTSTPGSSYKWFIKGGVQVAGGNSNAIQVNWGNKTMGWVKVLEFNKFNCPGDTVTLPVLVDHVLVAETPKGDTSICEFTKGVVYSVTYTRHSVYNWTVSGGTIVSGQLSNKIVVDWGAAGTGSVSMYETSYDSVNNIPCISNVITRIVNIRPIPTASEIEGIFEICQSPQSGTYRVKGFANSSYHWDVNGDDKLTGQGTSSITYPFSAFGSFKFTVTETSEYGCVGEPIDSTLVIHPKPTTSPIAGDAIVCYPNYNNHKYSVTGFNNSTYQWFVAGGTPNPNSVSNSIIVDWSGQQLNTVSVLETSEYGCVGDTIKLPVFFDQPSLDMTVVTVNPPPLADNGVDVTWKVINAPRYNNKFYIEKRKAGTTDSWVQVGEVNGTEVTYNESNISTDINAFEYRVKGFDLCNQPLYSEAHTDMLLTGRKKNGYESEMEFTPYVGWTNGVFQYDIYRKLPGKTEYELYEEDVRDFNAYYINGLEYFTQCYRVKATELNGGNTVSWSNEICYDFDPVLYIPNAFSPNGDKTNDVLVLGGGALKTVKVLIFNRWGEKLYELHDIKDTWDGTYKGQVVEDGVYMYNCIYEGFDGRLYSTKGTITVLR